MKLPITLQNKIIEFLKSLPNIDDTKKRQAFIYSANLDQELQSQLSFDEPAAQFVPVLVTILLRYGRLHDGRNALEAVLEATKNFIGSDRRIEECEPLIEELNALRIKDEENIPNIKNKEQEERREFSFTRPKRKWNIQLIIAILGLFTAIAYISNSDLIRWIYPLQIPQPTPTSTPVKTIGSGGNSKSWSEPNTGMEFVWIPSGTFKRGCNPCLSDECDTAEEIGVDIEMDGFWMGKYKVTEGQWKQVMGEGRMPAAYQQMYSSMGYTYPIRVFIPEARQFIQKLSTMNKGKYNFRLPQFIQWEYACRNAGKTLPPDCSDNKSSDQKTALPEITSVNAMSPNELGIYGMLVDWEWGDEPFPILEGDQPSTALQSKELSLAFGSSCLYWFAAGYMPLTIRVIMIP